MEDKGRMRIKDAEAETSDKTTTKQPEEMDNDNTEAGSFEHLHALAKKTAKDSVFCDLFQNPKYLLQLYQVLHPEDQNVTEEDIGIVTIRNVLLDQMYNDLGFMVGGRLLVLVEAQSTWTVNIIIRGLMYLAQTWQEYIETTGQNVYGSKKMDLPEPELYVIYTGDRKSRSEWISFSEEFFGGGETAVEVKVRGKPCWRRSASVRIGMY